MVTSEWRTPALSTQVTSTPGMRQSARHLLVGMSLREEKRTWPCVSKTPVLRLLHSHQQNSNSAHRDQGIILALMAGLFSKSHSLQPAWQGMFIPPEEASHLEPKELAHSWYEKWWYSHSQHSLCPHGDTTSYSPQAYTPLAHSGCWR